MSRDTGPVRFRYSSPAAQHLTDAGRKAMGEAKARGTAVARYQRELPGGGLVIGEQVGSQSIVTLVAPEDRVHSDPAFAEDIVYCYVGSPGGLRVFDLAKKRLVKTVTGLSSFAVDAVSASGQIVTMTEPAGYQAALVDLKALSAFGTVYRVDVYGAGGETEIELGYAHSLGLEASPDRSRLLIYFDQGAAAGGLVTDTVGGYVLADGDDLTQLRGAIRMGFAQAPCAWRGDSERFYLGTALADDAALTAGRLAAVTGSTSDYVAVFDKDGVLLGSRLFATWGFTPDPGWLRKVTALAASPDGRWLAVLVSDVGNTLHVIDAQDDTLPTVGTLVVAGDAALAMRFFGSQRLTLTVPGRVVEVALDDDGQPSPQHDLTATAFDAVLQLRTWVAPPALPLPRGRTPLPPRSWKFFLNARLGDLKTLRAYDGGFNREPIYEYDLGGLVLNHRYRLASVGTRPIRKSP